MRLCIISACLEKVACIEKVACEKQVVCVKQVVCMKQIVCIKKAVCMKKDKQIKKTKGKKSKQYMRSSCLPVRWLPWRKVKKGPKDDEASRGASGKQNCGQRE